MFLSDLLVVFAVTAAVVFAFGRARVPSVVGLLVSGVLVGPHGLSLVADEESVRLLAEIGVIVLLFTVGLEFSMSRLAAMLPLMAKIGLPQILGTTAIVAAATWWYLGTLPQAVFAGLLVAMSSTAIVMKMLADRGETASPHGRIAVAVLLLQDLLVVAAMLAVPLLAEAAGTRPSAAAHAVGGHAPAALEQPPLFESPLMTVAAGALVVAAVLVAGRYLVPRLLHEVVRLRNRELFLITIVLICLGTAAITGRVGLSLALGAFLAGLALSESEYGHQAFAEVLPFRDTLASLFFVSVGMLLDIRFLAANAALVTAAAVIPGLLERLSATAWCGRLLAEGPPETTAAAVRDHVIIAGFGLNGRNLSMALAESGVPHVILELNPETVRRRRAEGLDIRYGDCTRAAVLEHAGITRARA